MKAVKKVDFTHRMTFHEWMIHIGNKHYTNKRTWDIDKKGKKL